MTVEKSSVTTSLSAPATVTYSYLVSNTGNVTLTGISLSDNNDNDDMSCPFTTLAVGGSMTCTATHTFTQAELDAGGTLDNVVTASSNEAPDATDDLNIPITQTPAINVVKSSTTTSITAAGQVVPYSFVVTNVGNMTLTGITVTDPNCNAAPVYVSGDLNTDSKLQLTESWTYTCSHTVSQAEIDLGGNLSNTVTADSSGIGSGHRQPEHTDHADTCDQCGQVIDHDFDHGSRAGSTLQLRGDECGQHDTDGDHGNRSELQCSAGVCIR